MLHAMVTKVQGATGSSTNACKNASPPTLVGKQVKELSSTTHKIGKDDFTAVTITFTDGTAVMAAAAKPQGGAPNAGAFVVFDANGCPFAVS